MTFKKSIQSLVRMALLELGTAGRERIGVRLRMQGHLITSSQVGSALMSMSRRVEVQMVGEAVKGPDVRWELTPGPRS